MYHLQYTQQPDSILEIQQHFNAVGIGLNEEDLQKLLHYQQRICQKRNWIELDSHKFQEILYPFLQFHFLSYQNYQTVLQDVLLMYYILRSTFDHHLSDEQLIHFLYQNWQIQLTLGKLIQVAQLDKQLAAEGYAYRKERWNSYE